MEKNYTELIELYHVWVAVDQGQIIGGLVLIPKQDHMLLANIAVRPEYQGKGVGRAMLELTDAEALKQGYREIRLHVNRAMTEILEMYRLSGWTEIQNCEQEVHKMLLIRSFTYLSSGVYRSISDRIMGLSLQLRQ